MAFEVIVYFVPRGTRALWQTTFSATGDAEEPSLVVQSSEPPWQRPRTFEAWPVLVQFTGSLPEGNAPASTVIETPPSWNPPHWRIRYTPPTFWGAQVGDDTLAPTPEYSQGQIPRRDYRIVYKPWPAIRFGTPTLDTSVVISTVDSAQARVPRNEHQKPYTAWVQMGPGRVSDESWTDIYSEARVPRRPVFRETYGAQRVVRALFSAPQDDTPTVDAQPDQQATVVRRTFRLPYDARLLAHAFAGTAAYDDSVTVAAPDELQSSIPRNTFRERYSAKVAAVKFAGMESHDDSTAVVDLTGGVYIPTLRRRRR